MKHILVVSRESQRLEEFSQALAHVSGLEVEWAGSGQEALDLCARDAPLLVVADQGLADMTALELASRLLMVNAFINSAVVSELSPEDFHEESEGLGVLAQLGPQPDPAAAAELWAKLRPMAGV